MPEKNPQQPHLHSRSPNAAKLHTPLRSKTMDATTAAGVSSRDRSSGSGGTKTHHRSHSQPPHRQGDDRDRANHRDLKYVSTAAGKPQGHSHTKRDTPDQKHTQSSLQRYHSQSHHRRSERDVKPNSKTQSLLRSQTLPGEMNRPMPKHYATAPAVHRTKDVARDTKQGRPGNERSKTAPYPSHYHHHHPTHPADPNASYPHPHSHGACTRRHADEGLMGVYYRLQARLREHIVWD